ncbi:putative hydrolase of the HAD superfamily [Cystobacter fuscus DSM 2262]|uniref:Hydrolase of the HAD superfamily n=1 Tax=Cystobacter fuscus (strain ATCC 25194 / DSM 2262 / NBRC 100088 / M29) TaxID=1242864 RepID=S9P8I5_CYSF2|nr:HAD family hydrolase [Cystobacter fuscus]EPX58552.1 putative hydrolase of the HAD superfamily [Cystobacter fuscus DSM 2262]
MLKAVIYDLDDTLFPARSVPEEAARPMLTALREVLEGCGELKAARIADIMEQVWDRPLDEIARLHGLSAEVLDRLGGLFAGFRLNCELMPYPDIQIIEQVPGLRILVTTGFRRLQESKIECLGIAHYFDRIIVDALGEPERKGKQAIFREFLEACRLRPEEVVVLGDNPHSEIDAGNKLGIPTVQILRGRKQAAASASFHVEDLARFLRWLETRGMCPPSSPMSNGR